MEHLIPKSCIDDMTQRFPNRVGEVLHALRFAMSQHDGQYRASGAPYIEHPVAVAMHLYFHFHDIDLCIAGLLHDTVEDCHEVNLELIEREFGLPVALLVDAVTKNRLSSYASDAYSFSNYWEKLFWYGFQDIRAFILKIADRENNLNSLHYLTHNQQLKIALETKALYYPISQLLQFHTTDSLVLCQDTFTSFLLEQHLTTPKDFVEFFCEDFLRENALELLHLFPELYSTLDTATEQVHELLNYAKKVELHSTPQIHIEEKEITINFAA